MADVQGESESTTEGAAGKTKDVIDAVTGLVRAVPIYDDLARPAAKQLGKALETVAKTVNMALAPVGSGATNRFKSSFQEKLRND